MRKFGCAMMLRTDYALKQDDEHTSEDFVPSGDVGAISSRILKGTGGENFFHARSDMGYKAVDVLD